MVDDEVICVICGRRRPKGQCHVIELTAKEKAAFRDMNQTPLDLYVYCRPCWKNVTDPVTGPAFMKTLFEVLLTRGGVQDSEKMATKFHAWLSKRAREPKA